MKNADCFINEKDYPDLKYDRAVRNLQSAIRFRTVNHLDTGLTDYSQFDALHAFLRSSYPLLALNARWEKIGHSLLICLNGSDETLLPALFMAHQDVVPVVEGTEKNWVHGPFSGDLEDGFIWGRGAMDIKQMLIAEMESAEYLLSKGCLPRRGIYFAFGEDEETCSRGAMAIVERLEKEGVRFEYVLDEGAGDVTDAEDWGAPGTHICTVGMYEKGYADLKICASSRGGHSSNPFYGTSLGALADAIHAITHSMPPARMSDSLRASLKLLAPLITQSPMREWARDIGSHENEILQWFSGRESLYHLVKTTAAPTMISPGAPAGNVMPQDMWAVINFRLIPSDTPEGLMERFSAAAGKSVSLSWQQQIAASVPSDLNSYGYGELVGTLEYYFDGLRFIPAQNKGATDARHYEGLSRCVMRFGPFLEEEDISREGIHGTNERISVRAFAQGVRVLTRLMERTCFI